jgi:hypothetical protein
MERILRLYTGIELETGETRIHLTHQPDTCTTQVQDTQANWSVIAVQSGALKVFLSPLMSRAGRRPVISSLQEK